MKKATVSKPITKVTRRSRNTEEKHITGTICNPFHPPIITTKYNDEPVILDGNLYKLKKTNSQKYELCKQYPYAYNSSMALSYLLATRLKDRPKGFNDIVYFLRKQIKLDVINNLIILTNYLIYNNFSKLLIYL
jgi:hypothetical protein